MHHERTMHRYAVLDRSYVLPFNLLPQVGRRTETPASPCLVENPPLRGRGPHILGRGAFSKTVEQ